MRAMCDARADEATTSPADAGEGGEMQCAFCGETLPATWTAALDHLAAVCQTGCDGYGRFIILCPSCHREVATFDLHLGYDAEALAEECGLPFYGWAYEGEYPDEVLRNGTLNVEDLEFELVIDGQTITASVIGPHVKYVKDRPQVRTRRLS